MTDWCCFGLNPSCWTFGNMTPWLQNLPGNGMKLSHQSNANTIGCNTKTQDPVVKLMHFHDLYCQRDVKWSFCWATDGNRSPPPVTLATPKQAVYQIYQSIIASDQYLQQSVIYIIHYNTIELQFRWGMIGQCVVQTSKVRLKRVLSKPLIPTNRLSAKSSILTLFPIKKKGRIEMFVQTWTWMCNNVHT